MGNSNHKHEIIQHFSYWHDDNYKHDDNYRVLGRVQRNDPALKELTLDMPWNSISDAWILQAFDAIATNSSLEILNIKVHAGCFLPHDEKDRVRREVKNQVKRALSCNTALKQIRITNVNPTMDDELSTALDIIMTSPNLEVLIQNYHQGPGSSIKDITAMMQVVSMNSNLQSLTIEGFPMFFQEAVAFAAAFQGNKTIKTLTICWPDWIRRTGAVSVLFVQELPQDHSLETLVFRASDGFDDGSAVAIVQTLCHKHLKNLSLEGTKITQKGCERIVQTLKENEHSFTELDLFWGYENSWWQNKTQLEIDLLTWSNRLQFEKEMWVDQFLEQDNPTKELLFLALDRAKNVDSIPTLALEERAKKVDSIQISKPPNMLFHLIKEKHDLIARAIHHGH